MIITARAIFELFRKHSLNYANALPAGSFCARGRECAYNESVRGGNRSAITYKRKSCSQHGLAPFTVTVVDLTFCSFNVT